MDRSVYPSADLATLRARALVLRRIRDFFERHGFLEVDTPVLSHDTVVDRYLQPVPVLLPVDDQPGSASERMWLQTSPEFAMKRIVAAGAEAIFQIAHAFRVGERGEQHNPEFTMVEWYRVGDDQAAAIDLLGELACLLFERSAWNKLDYRTACQNHAGVDPFSDTDDQLHQAVQSFDPYVELVGVDRDGLLNLLMAERIQPALGNDGPTILFDYPASQAALAKTVERNYGTVAERFELFYQGVELANGYHELTDADELLRRNERVNQMRKDDGKTELPEQSRLVEAMQRGLPACAGVALGFDRVIMLILGKSRIDEVIPFPIERA